MSSKIIQDNRLVAVDTPFGKDALQLFHVHGKEYVNDLFFYELSMLSEDIELESSKIIGKKISFTIEIDNGKHHEYSGYVTKFKASSPESVGNSNSGKIRHYYAEVVPWLWFLGKTTDCRIFQDKSIPDIISEVFKDHSISNFSTSALTDTYPKHEYCVQYRETDLVFVTRLLEEAGISYFFEQGKDNHKLVLTDDKSGFDPCPESEVDFEKTTGNNDHITEWQKATSFHSGKFAQRSYNFKTPSTDLTTNAKATSKLPDINKYEIFDFPGEYYEKGDGKTETRVRMEETEMRENTILAKSLCRTFYAGGTFKLKEYSVESEKNTEYLITSIEFEAKDTTQTTGLYSEEYYTNKFLCVPKKIQVRPERKSKKPQIHGIQTAVVTGASGDEIYVDKFGRIKVQFHWDRHGKNNESSSCWIRVSQTWAGEGWGAVFHPRVGQEVVVSFIEGDPDRPLITGRVYNAEQVLPYECPSKKTQSGIKSRSTKGGGKANFNEIRFEDKKGDEQVYVHAEKNMDTVIENDETLSVGNNRTKVIGNDEKIDVGSNRNARIGTNDTLEVGSNLNINAGSSITIKTGAAQIKMSSDGTIKIKGVSVSVEGVTTKVKGSATAALKGGIVTIN
ncbi:MAG: type VI secretion system tip protein VgrG [Gammaproteobacteria bacterium]|nr:MAG: type VI secretion system tip protein VgrG [Gammaproteobacteria bacterium]